MDITKSQYANFLEGFCESVLELQPDKIGVCAILPDGSVLTGYHGNCTHQDKAIMGYHFHTDAVMDTVEANAKRIVEAANSDEEGEDNG